MTAVHFWLAHLTSEGSNINLASAVDLPGSHDALNTLYVQREQRLTGLSDLFPVLPAAASSVLDFCATSYISFSCFLAFCRLKTHTTNGDQTFAKSQQLTQC